MWGWEDLDQLWKVSPDFLTPWPLLFITGFYNCVALESHELNYTEQRFSLFYKLGLSIDENLSCRVEVGMEMSRNLSLNY